MDAFAEYDRLIGHQVRFAAAARNLRTYLLDLRDRGLPPLVDLASLAQFSGTSLDYLSRAIVATDEKYREFTIPKRSGGERSIEAPNPPLLRCQRWINANILAQLDTSPAATAYKAKIGAKENATQHVGSQFVLKLDLEDFFHSIPIARAISVFMTAGYPHKLSFELASLCCLRGRLAQGAATSPSLSNIIAGSLDRRMLALAANQGLQYSRYSDDLTLSGPNLDFDIVATCRAIIRDQGFVMNEKKTTFYRGRGKCVVTGIAIDSGRLRVPKAKRRMWRKEFHDAFIARDVVADTLNGARDVFFIDSFSGKLRYWLHVESDARFPREALARVQQEARRLREMVQRDEDITRI